jgi:ribosomal protein S1
MLNTDLLNTTQKVIIYERSDDQRILKGSIRRQLSDPWPEIHRNLPKGTLLRGIVTEVNTGFVRVQLPGNLYGTISRQSMLNAGFEYEKYELNVIQGQGLDVVVTKVFIGKRKIRLDLARNFPKTKNPEGQT